MRTLDSQDLEDIINGACFLGCGGGGPLSTAQDMLETILSLTDKITVLDAAEADADDTFVVTAYIGSATAAVNTAFKHLAPTDACQRLVQAINRPLAGVLPAEVGAVNSLAPMTVAARMNIPVIDADGAGRAVPEIMLTTYASRQIPISPVVVANEKAEQVLLYVQDAVAAERLVRPIVASPPYGGIGGLALWAMNGAILRKSAITGTLQHVQSLGAVLRWAREHRNDPVQAILSYLGDSGKVLFMGEIVRITTQSSGGFDFATVVLRNDNGAQVWIYSQNENMLAWWEDNQAPIAMSPDLICYITPEGQPLSNADLRQGQWVCVMSVQARPEMRHPFIVNAFLTIFKRLGYAGPYVPIERLSISA
jgi:uncharacterized protein